MPWINSAAACLPRLSPPAASPAASAAIRRSANGRSAPAAYAAAVARRNGASAGAPSAAGLAATAESPIPGGSLGQEFLGIRNCESGDRYSLDSGNGYYGAYQFSLGTWAGLGEPGLPSAAPPVTQDAAAYLLYQHDGWSPWPECAALLGLG